MPLQHINDRVLKRMIRRVDRDAHRERCCDRLRDKWPDLAMRTTFIVGFPGETEAEFEELKQFVADFKFERLGVFPYSLEPGTPAEKLDGHLPEEVKQARVDRDHGGAAAGRVRVGRGAGRQGTPGADRRPGPGVRQPLPRPHLRRRPDIDCEVRVKGKNLRPGDFVKVKVTAADGYDLVGRRRRQAVVMAMGTCVVYLRRCIAAEETTVIACMFAS